jgi:protein phosphatase 2C family protein 2/3
MSTQSLENTPMLQLRLKCRATSLVELKNSLTPRLLPQSLRSPREKATSKTHIPIPALSSHTSNPTKLKTSKKAYGLIKAFAAGTNQGLVRSYNEDRVTIMPKVSTSESKENFSYFALFDGHGGSGCADYLAENLHRFIFRHLSSSSDIKESLKTSFSQAESHFINSCLQKTSDKSGSCATCALITENFIYLANTGDSRAIIGTGKGKVLQVSEDHKPAVESEKSRIEKAGGVIVPGNRFGVARVLPGRLSVSRSFGDVTAKMKHLGGLPGVLIASPDIYRVKMQESLDYLLIASDGIFDVLSNEEVNQMVWEGLLYNGNYSERLGKAVSAVIDLALERGSSDNVTVILVGFSDRF